VKTRLVAFGPDPSIQSGNHDYDMIIIMRFFTDKAARN